MKKRFLSMLVLLAAVVTGAWATDYTTLAVGDVIKVGDTFSPTADGAFNDFGFSSDKTYTLIRADIDDGYNVTEKTDGAYYVFKSVSIMNPYMHFEKAFAVTAISDGLEVTNIETGKGISYTLALHEPTAPPTYSITLDEGTGNKDSQNWEITPKSSELSGSEAVTVKYNGSREVKSVTVVKKAAVNPNTYLKWDGTQKKLVATPMPESFTTVTSDNTEWSAGTYVVEGEVDINGTIVLNGDVNLIIKDGAKLDVYHLYGNSHNLSIYGQAQMTGELDVNHSGGDAINEIPTLEVHSAKVTATSSYDYGAGFYEIGTFNVYGGSVDAKGTHAEGGCGICLKENGSLNIYGGEVKAEGKGIDSDSYGITCGESLATTVKVYGGKLWAGCADNRALNNDGITLAIDKSLGFNGEIETSSDNSTWNPTVGTPDTKYVRVGY